MMMGSEMTAASAAARAVPLIIEAAQWIYMKMNEPKPLIDREDGNESFADKTHYERLCRFRLDKIDRDKIPEEWKLDNDRHPVYGVNFGERAKRLQDHVERLLDSTCPQKTQVLAMIRRIIGLFQILQARRSTLIQRTLEATKEVVWDYSGYRCDGVEAMFFADLALWISITLPSLTMHDQQSIDTVEAWIQYCKKVQREVLIYRWDEQTPNNPKQLLESIITDLDRLKLDMEKAKNYADFNMKARSISVSLRNMINDTFDFLYLLNENAPDDNIQVSYLLEQYNKYDKNDTFAVDQKIQKIFQNILGHWLVETLQAAGIVSNDFESKTTIDPTLIHNHFNTDFNNAHLRKTGLWPFALQNDMGKIDQSSKARVHQYMVNIGNIKRLLLMICHVHEALILGAMLGKDVGDAWIYGENSGRGITLVLLKVIVHSSMELSEKIVAFKTDFLAHHTQYMKRHPKDIRDHCYRNLGKIIDISERILGHSKTIKLQCQDVKDVIKNYKHNTRDIENRICLLKQLLATYVHLTKLPLEEDLKQVIGLATPSQNIKVVEVTRYVFTDQQVLLPQKDTKLRYPKSTLPYYNRMLEILSGTNVPLVPNDMNIITTRLRAGIQEQVYTHYLKAKDSVLNLTEFGKYFSYFWCGIPSDKINAFIEHYNRIRAIFFLLYFSSSISGIPRNTLITPLEYLLADIDIREFILNDFDTNQYYEFNALPPAPPFKIAVEENEVVLTFTGDWYDAIKGSLLEASIAPFIQSLQEKNRQLEKALRIAVEEIKIKDTIIENLKQETKRQIAETTAKAAIINARLEALEAERALESQSINVSDVSERDDEKNSQPDEVSYTRASHDLNFHGRDSLNDIAPPKRRCLISKSIKTNLMQAFWGSKPSENSPSSFKSYS